MRARNDSLTGTQIVTFAYDIRETHARIYLG